ncbi:phage major tail tube protein [Comamonas sp. CMM03]|uniref:phage major tail tube protein n=1 Tax=Comamonas sp. CMM03 TaxID=2854781 RepID=UPI001C4676E0|nr:phage major tail tube protein [Comamonas sp. CMM03]MBV7417973.1 phage major tail tube protein [Comamonas sp. CMM03]
MGMPKVLKHFAVFADGLNYTGEVEEIVLPKLTRKLEEYRSGGMNLPAKTDMGMEALEAEITFGGWMKDVIRQFGAAGVNAVPIRFVGTVQSDDDGQYSAVEVSMRGRWEEIDMGSGKAGDKSEFKCKVALNYYRLTWDGEELIEIDAIRMIEKFAGVDQFAVVRQLLGI